MLAAGPLAYGQNYIVKMKETGQLPNTLIHASEWQTTLRRADLIMQWTCTEFQSPNDTDLVQDAELTMKVTAQNGILQISPTTATDRTNVQKNDRQASVATSVSGVGSFKLALTLELMGEFVAAGEYVNTVELNITSH
jgi:hypothetical protein